MYCAEASCHWGTWCTCPPDSVATLVNCLQNQVNSITLCVTLNANTGKIVLVTLCIQIEWLFYNAFWCETVTRKWHWLHPRHGCTKSKKNKKQESDQTDVLTTRKRLPKRLIVLVKPKKWRARQKNFRRIVPDMCPPLLNSLHRRWIGLHRLHRHHHRLVHKTVGPIAIDSDILVTITKTNTE